MSAASDTAELLARVMDDHGYANPQELSEASGVPYNTVYRWTTGKSNPHRRSLVNFLRALHVDPEVYGVKVPASRGSLDSDEAPQWFVKYAEEAEARAARRHDELTTALGATRRLHAGPSGRKK